MKRSIIKKLVHLLPFIISVALLLASATPAAAAISFESNKVGTSPYITGTTPPMNTYLQLAKPDGIQVGDFLLASISVQGGIDVTVTPPSDWHPVHSTISQSLWLNLLTYYKFVNSDDIGLTSFYEWQINYHNDALFRLAVGSISRYTGVDPALPVDTVLDSVGVNGSGVSTATAPSVTTRCPDDRVVTIYGAFVPVETFSTPQDTNSINYVHYHPEGEISEKWRYPSLAVFDASQPTAGASGEKTTTMTPTNIGEAVWWTAQTIALKTVLPTPAVNITGNNIQENSSGQADVSLTHLTADTVTMHCTIGGTAVNGVDYTMPDWGDYVDNSGTLTIGPGQKQVSLTIQPIDNRIHDGNKSVVISISNPTNAVLGTNTTYTATIVDEDPENYVNVTGVDTVLENSSGQVNVNLDYASSSQVTLHCQVDGTAVQYTDYTLTNWDNVVDGSGIMTFNPGETVKSFTIQPINDYQPDPSKTVIITISNPAVAVLGANSVYTATILDDDSANWLSISDMTLNEGNSGSTDAVFTVTLSPAASTPVTVNYATADGMAHAAGDISDYAAQSGTLNFATGETQKTITVSVNGDNIYETYEYFYVNLTSPAGASLGDSQSEGGIINDDWTKPAFNEFVVHHGGTVDTNEFIEIKGYPSTNYSDYRILVIENDGDQNPGIIDRIYTPGLTNAEGIWRTPFFNSELEDGRCIIMLVEDFIGTVGQDLDANNDLWPEIHPWNTYFDYEGVIDIIPLFNPDPPSLTMSYVYPYLSGTYGASRFTDDYGSLYWLRNDFGGAGFTGFISVPTIGQAYNSPGIPNVKVPASHTVQFDLGDHGTRTGGGELWQYIVPGSSAVAPAVSPEPGWTFTGWDKDFSCILHDYKDTISTLGAVHARYSEAVFFSEYVEGSGNNKALEIYNGSSSSINLADGWYDIRIFFNGSTSPGLTVPLTGIIEPGDVYVIVPSTASAAVLVKADQIDNHSWFDGNDAIVLRKNGTIVDVIGQIGFNPGDQGWGTDPTNTTDNTLRRIMTITSGDANGSNAFDPSLEWQGFAPDTLDDLGIPRNLIPTVGFTKASSSNSEAVTTVNIPAVLSAASTNTVTVDYSVTGTATGVGVDYTLENGALSFSPGETSKNITMAVVNDSLAESTETIIVTLFNQVNAIVGAYTVYTYTINDDDSPGITASPSSGLVTSEDGGQAIFTIGLNTMPERDVTVYLNSSDATEGTVSPSSEIFTVIENGTQVLLPDSDGGSSSNWSPTPTSSSAYECVNDTSDVNDFISAESNISNHTAYSMFGFSPADIPDNATITGLTVHATGRETSSGANDIWVQIQLKNGHTYRAPSFLIPDSNFKSYSYTWTNNPVGGAWTVDQIEGTGTDGLDQFGISVTDMYGGVDVSSVWAEVSYTVPGNWNAPRTITVTGEDDPDVDGNTPYTIDITGAGGGGDYNGYTTSVDVVNNDNDVTLGPVNPDVSTVAADLEILVADGNAAAVITVVVMDSNHNPIPNASVRLSASPATVTFDDGSFGGVTDASGVFTRTVTSTTAGSYTITATVDSVVLTQQPTLTFTPGPAYRLVFTQHPSDGVAGIVLPIQPQITVQDQFSNTVTPSSDSITLTIGNNPGGGPLTVAGNPLTPINGVAGFSGVSLEKVGYGYTLTASSGSLIAATSNSFDIKPNTPPIVYKQGVATNEDTPRLITLTGFDSEGVSLSYFILLPPAHGILTEPAGPDATYTPNAEYSGRDSFDFYAFDGINYSEIATVDITILAVNDPPIAGADSVTTDEDTSVDINVLANDSDFEGHVLTLSSVTSPGHGEAVIIGGTVIAYFPAANYNGEDTFDYTVSDGTDTTTARVTITITPVEDVPVAYAQSVTTNEDTAVSITLAGSVPDDSSLAYSVTAQPSHGSLTGTAPSVTYTPVANYNGPDSFTFKVNDGKLDSNTATVSITISAVNDVPVAVDDYESIGEDMAWKFSVLRNDHDVDGNTLTVTGVTTPGHGTVVINSDSTVTYTSAVNYNGNDSFGYTISDGTATATATVSVYVYPLNDYPWANNQSVSTDEDTPLTITLTGGDPENDPLTYLLLIAPSHGNVSITGSGPEAIYTPSANYKGSDSFTFRSHDGYGVSTPATVSITINSVNDAPVITEGDSTNVTMSEDGSPIAFSLTLHATDVDGNTLTWSISSAAGHGTATAFGTGIEKTIGYVPNADYISNDNFAVQVTDGQGGTDTIIVNVTIEATNAAPVANSQTVTMNEDTLQTITLMAADADGNPLTYSIVGSPTSGTLGQVSGSTVTYTPGIHYNGSDSFTFKANDETEESNIATVSITVNAVNDPPSFLIGDRVTVVEDSGAYSAAFATSISSGPADESTQELTFQIVNNSLPDLFLVPPAISSTGTLTFTLASNLHGWADIIITLGDNGGVDNGGVDTSIKHAFTIAVNPINDAPGFMKGADQTVLEDAAAQSITGWATDISAGPNENDQAVTFHVSNDNNALFSAQPAITANATLTYTPAANANGSATVTVYMTDDSGTANGGDDTSKSQTFTITVTPVNDPPSFIGGGDVTVDEDSGAYSAAFATSISSGPADESTQELTFQIVNNSLPDLFLVPPAISSTGTLTFTLASNLHGWADIIITLGDNGGVENGGVNSSTTQAFTLRVNQVNDAPVASEMALQTNEDSPLAITLAATDVDGDRLTYSFTEPEHGILSGSGPEVTFTPDLDYNGSVSFTFKVSDGTEDSNIVTVSIAVNAIDDAPAAANDNYNIDEDAVLNVASPGLLANDADIDSTSLTVILVSNVKHGDLALGMDGSFTYSPEANYNGTDSFTYKANDGQLDSIEVMVTINIAAVNDAPVAPEATASALEDTSISVTLAATDVDGDPLTYTFTQPVHGSLSSTAPDLTYTPAANYNGSDSFTYTANDGQYNSSAATVSIDVTPVNDPPTDINLNTDNVNENLPSGTTVGTFSTTDIDTGDTFTYSLAAGDGDTDNSSFVIDGITLKTAASFDYETRTSCIILVSSTDANGLSFTEQFTITVNNILESPAISLQPASLVASAGQTAEFTAKAAGDATIAVQWQLSNNSGKKWTNIAGDNTTIASGVTSSTYTTNTITTNMNGYQYRAVFTNSIGNATSSAATLSVNSPSTVPPAFTSASTTTFNEGTDYSFTITTTGNPVPAISYSGELPLELAFTDNGDGTATLSGIAASGTEGSYSLTITAANGILPDATQAFTLNVSMVNNPPTDISLSNSNVDENLPVGTTVGTFSTEDQDAGNTFTYSLAAVEGNTDNASFTIAGNILRTTAVLDFETQAAYSILVESTDQGGLSFEKQLTITVNDITEYAPVITTQPVDRMVYAGQSATFTTVANGNPIPIVQWQLSTNGGVRWEDISGAASPSYTTPAATTMDGYQYRAVYTNLIGSITTSAAALHIATTPDSTMDAVVTQSEPVYDPKTRTLTWTITVSNTKNSPALNVKVSDTLASGTKITSVKVTSGTYKVSGNTLNVNISSLSKSKPVTITIKVLVSKPIGTITNTATIVTGNVDSDLSNNTCKVSYTFR